MENIEKIEQARQLLAEAGVTYVLAYEKDSETIANSVNGTGEGIVNCIGALVNNLAGKLAEGGAPKDLVEIVIGSMVGDAIDEAYEENENN